MIKVKAGVNGEEKIFQVHKGLLRSVSPRMKGKVENGLSKAGDDEVLEFPTLQADVFGHFRCWLYTDSIVQRGVAK